MVWSTHIPWLRWPGFPGRLRSAPRPAGEADWRRDPLSHPALQAMTRRQLDDLPIDRRSIAEE